MNILQINLIFNKYQDNRNNSGQKQTKQQKQFIVSVVLVFLEYQVNSQDVYFRSLSFSYIF